MHKVSSHSQFSSDSNHTPGRTEGDPVLSDDMFKRFSDLAFQRTGIVLKQDKKTLVFARLSKRLKALGLKNFEEYEDFLKGPKGAQEDASFINAITTNLTRFFRENHHFEHIKNVVLPKIIERYEHNPTSEHKRVRFWSAGCSSGEEAYSLAMVCAAHLPSYFDLKILATDIDTNMVAKAKAGIYSQHADIPHEYQAYCIPGQGSSFSVSSEVRRLITFNNLNLLEDWPIHGPFQAIFCRNVVIYFNKETQKTLFERLATVLEPKGWLYVGHSESLFKVTNVFTTSGQTIYQKEMNS